MWRLVALALGTALGMAAAGAAAAEPLSLLFVGNSYTFGRAAPVLGYNATAVSDMTARFAALDARGTHRDEPHPWGGVPGIVKKLADQAGLDWEVSLSARNGASLRGHFLNAAGTTWDLRGNVASRRWDLVVLQEQSDAALAKPAAFNEFVDRFERFIHDGAACDPPCELAPNPHASPTTRVYLEQPWARPDRVPAMTAALHAAFAAKLAANPRLAGVAPVGDAFRRAVDQGLAVDLWWQDRHHASKFGSYLAALVLFGQLAGRDPRSFGPNEQAAADLGIAPATALALQRIAGEQLSAASSSLP